VSTAKKPDWLYTDFLLSMFSETPGQAITEYRKFVQGEESEEIKDFYSKKNLPSILGSRNFVEWVKAKYYQKKKHDEVPQSKDLAPTIIEIKKSVGLCYKIDIKELEESKRGQENEPRNVAIYLSRKHSGLSLAKIGKEFGCIKYSTVSNVVRRIEKQLTDSNQLCKMVALIKQRLFLEQRKICPLIFSCLRHDLLALNFNLFTTNVQVLIQRKAEVVAYGRLAMARLETTSGPSGVADRTSATGSRPRTACLSALVHRRSGRRAAAASDDLRRITHFSFTKTR
jgi:hypothetical protein